MMIMIMIPKKRGKKVIHCRNKGTQVISHMDHVEIRKGKFIHLCLILTI